MNLSKDYMVVKTERYHVCYISDVAELLKRFNKDGFYTQMNLIENKHGELFYEIQVLAKKEDVKPL